MCKELKELFEAATEANMEKYCQLVDRFPDLKSEKVLTYLREANYFTAPSSIRFHGDWIGGNFDHSMKVTEFLLQYTAEEGLHWSREESPYIIGMFHDMCKCDQRKFVMKNGEPVILFVEGVDKRHSERSIELIEKNIISMTVEEKLCIYYHMGEYGGDEEYKVLMREMISKNPNIMFTQLADSTAAKMGI